MAVIRKFSLVLVVLAALVLGSPRPVAAPEFGDWATPVMLGPEINSAPTYGAVITRDGLNLFCTRGSGLASNLYVARRSSVDEAWDVPENLGAGVNTEYTEMIPALSRDEHWLLFTSDRPGSESWDLWASWRPHTSDPFGWQAPVNLGPNVNSSAQETTGSFLENEDGWPPLLFFASNRLMGIVNPTPGQLPIGHDIYVSELQADGTFGPAVLVADLSICNGGLQDMEGRPMVRCDGREVIFVSDRPGSVGAQDLWFARRESVGDSWGTPLNLAAVNTPAAELHPYLSPDGQTLYFSRRVGADLRIFMTTRERPGRSRQR